MPIRGRLAGNDDICCASRRTERERKKKKRRRNAKEQLMMTRCGEGGKKGFRRESVRMAMTDMNQNIVNRKMFRLGEFMMRFVRSSSPSFITIVTTKFVNIAHVLPQSPFVTYFYFYVHLFLAVVVAAAVAVSALAVSFGFIAASCTCVQRKIAFSSISEDIAAARCVALRHFIIIYGHEHTLILSHSIWHCICNSISRYKSHSSVLNTLDLRMFLASEFIVLTHNVGNGHGHCSLSPSRALRTEARESLKLTRSAVFANLFVHISLGSSFLNRYWSEKFSLIGHKSTSFHFRPSPLYTVHSIT